MARTVFHPARLMLLFAAAAVVCSAQFPFSNSNEYAAKALTVTGQVSVYRDLQPWAVMVGDTINVQQMIFTGPDGHAMFQVSDGSTFEVYPNSRVVFRQTPGNWRDLLDVIIGRVRVQIQHWGNVPNPNKVRTPAAVVSVRGTVFDVSVEDDEDTTLIEVEEGSVEVQHARLPRGNPKVLQQGESLRVYRDAPLEARLIHKGTILQQALRITLDTLTTIATRPPGGGGIPGGGGGGGGVGDTGKTNPPPPAPPPLPPLN
jgi:hypothetical protein